MRIATRGSDLALWQANWVRDQLRSQNGIEAELVVVKSAGDRDADRPLKHTEGAGFFSKEIELAVLYGKAEVAVHSHKDLPVAETPGLTVAAVPVRAAPEDWLLIRHDRCDSKAPCWPLVQGARVGTSSPRRSVQLRHRRPDLSIADIRGNVPVRLARLRRGEFDAVVLARAGLDRLGADLSDLSVVDLLPSGVLPAPGQGALALQCRSDDVETTNLLAGLNDPASAACVRAERRLLSMLEGGCALALGCLARPEGTELHLDAALWRGEGDMRTCAVTADAADTVARLAFEALTAP